MSVSKTHPSPLQSRVKRKFQIVLRSFLNSRKNLRRPSTVLFILSSIVINVFSNASHPVLANKSNDKSLDIILEDTARENIAAMTRSLRGSFNIPDGNSEDSTEKGLENISTDSATSKGRTLLGDLISNSPQNTNGENDSIKRFLEGKAADENTRVLNDAKAADANVTIITNNITNNIIVPAVGCVGCINEDHKEQYGPFLPRTNMIDWLAYMMLTVLAVATVIISIYLFVAKNKKLAIYFGLRAPDGLYLLEINKEKLLIDIIHWLKKMEDSLERAVWKGRVTPWCSDLKYLATREAAFLVVSVESDCWKGEPPKKGMTLMLERNALVAIKTGKSNILEFHNVNTDELSVMAKKMKEQKKSTKGDGEKHGHASDGFTNIFGFGGGKSTE